MSNLSFEQMIASFKAGKDSGVSLTPLEVELQKLLFVRKGGIYTIWKDEKTELYVSSLGKIVFEVEGSCKKTDRRVVPCSSIKQTIKAFKWLTSALPKGTKLHCLPYQDDGFGDKRRKYFSNIGFIKDPGNQTMNYIC